MEIEFSSSEVVANQILAEMQSADKNLTVGAMTAAQSRSNLSTEYFTVTTGYINPIFHICNSANEFFPTIDILDFVKENKNNKKINYKTGIFLIVIGILSLGVKQISIIRNAPQIIYNLVQLMIKLPSGLGICFCIISINKKIFLKPLSMVGKIAYELYLVHGYILENANASINGCFAFWIFSLFIAIVLHELLTLIRKYMVMIMKVQ